LSRGSDFWARRKAAVEAEAAAEKRATEEERIAVDHARLEEKPDEEILAELNLPDPDTLKPGDTVEAFMSKAVPDRIRRRALRQLFRLNPALANIDGLVDYGEDFTDAALVVENLQTTYQVGKGMLAHVQEMARQAEAEAMAQETPAQEDVPADQIETNLETEQVAVVSPVPAAPEMEEAAPSDQTREEDSDTRFAAAPRRRMRFAFEE
jgi:hypothetical protein